MIRCRWTPEWPHYRVETANRSYLQGIPEPERSHVVSGLLSDDLPADVVDEALEHFDRARTEGLSGVPAQTLTELPMRIGLQGGASDQGAAVSSCR